MIDFLQGRVSSRYAAAKEVDYLLKYIRPVSMYWYRYLVGNCIAYLLHHPFLISIEGGL